MYTKKDWKCCPEYNGETEEILMTNCKHYAKLVCAKCKHFIKWLPNPTITKELGERVDMINNVISKYDKTMSQKHKDFLNNVKSKRFMTPSQHSYYENLISKYPL